MKLDINKLTWEATDALIKLDNTFINTPNYMGLTYFWNYDYRHALRESPKSWLKVHTEMLKAGLDVSEASKKHADIIRNILKIDWIFDHEQEEVVKNNLILNIHGKEVNSGEIKDIKSLHDLKNFVLKSVKESND